MEVTGGEGTGFSAQGLDAVRAWIRGWVGSGRLPGALTLLARHGRVRFVDCCGLRDVEAGEPLEPDTLFRIYSMTKPVTACAALVLVQEGLLSLDEPVARTIPSFERLSVNRAGAGDELAPEPARVQMTVRHLLTHTSGLTYGAGNPGVVSRLYRERRTDFGPEDGPLAEVVERLADIPLLFEPGTAWTYGVSSDVLGRVIEVASGEPLDRFMQRRIFEPLGMHETSFQVAAENVPRFASLYEATRAGGLALLETPTGSPQHTGVATFSGGSGLVSSARDFFRFAEFLRCGGAIDGARVLDETLVRSMTTNQLGGDLASLGQATFNEMTTDGAGYGLGVGVVVDPSRTHWSSTRGEFGWGGYASTAFWVDPEHDVTAIFLTQVIPSDRYPIRVELHDLVAQALVPPADRT